MLKLQNPAILSAMAGINDGFFCARAAKSGAGMVTLGGFNFDKATLDAARLLTTRGRAEFIIALKELPEYIEHQVSTAREGKALVSINVRVASRDGLVLAAKVAQRSADAIELNVHCWQTEILDLETGQALLKNQEKLCQYIVTLKAHIDIPLIVKIRANVVDEVPLAKKIVAAGADAIHIDAMKPGYPNADLDVIKKISDSVDVFLIGNNSVKDINSAIQMLNAGADAFSIARAAINKPEIVGYLGSRVLETFY
ncbi:MAG: MJ0144 family RNA dihydrouridine synthase-like protein [Promethearchaeota archaeon]